MPDAWGNYRSGEVLNASWTPYTPSGAAAPAAAPVVAPSPSAGNVQGDYDAWRNQVSPMMNRNNRFEAGLSANIGRLNSLLEDPNSIQQTAAYRFRLGQGEEALNRSKYAKGMGGSGNRLMALAEYGQNMASQEYENQFNRLSSLVNQYSQNWIGDKNANTAQFAAESQAHLGRGNILADLVKAGNANATNLQIAQLRQQGSGSSGGGDWKVTHRQLDFWGNPLRTTMINTVTGEQKTV